MPPLVAARRAAALCWAWALLSSCPAAVGLSTATWSPSVGGGAAELAAELVDLPGASSACKADLRKYLLCNAVSGLFAACSSQPLLNSTVVQALLGCATASPRWPERLKVCQGRCEDVASRFVNDTVQGPCAVDFQAMHGFSAPLNIFTIGGVDVDLNMSTLAVLPLPNMKGITGPAAINYGEPDKCAEIRSAHYCVLSGMIKATGPMTQPTFAMGNCLPRSCGEEELDQMLANLSQGLLKRRLDLHIQCGLVEPVGKEAIGSSKQIQDFMGWGGTPVHYPNKIPVKTGFWVMAAVCILFAALLAAGTVLQWRQEAKRRLPVQIWPRASGESLQEAGLAGLAAEASLPLAEQEPEEPEAPPRPRGALRAFLCHWSLLRNGRAFLKTRPREQNPFPCIDAVRAFAMGQVIVGHTYFFAVGTAGISNLEQFSPPNGLLGNWWFQIIPGCFYGVDSFFVLSGLLCAYSLEQKVFSKARSRSPVRFVLMYLKFVLNRFLRLAPLEMFCIFLCLYMLPQMGTGLLWNMDMPGGKHCSDNAGGGEECATLWWTNLLFIQDLDRYVARCFGHTWYLAVDFQLYLTAPFFALAYSLDRRLGWALLSLAMAGTLAASVALTAHYGWVPEMIAGSTKGFADKFYFKPWCRAPAFLVGIAVGWLWPSVFSRYKGQHRSLRGHALSYLLALLGIGLCAVATFGRVAFFQCDIPSCMDADLSPVSRALQYVWGALSILTWCVGLAIVMVLCCQGRFLPVLQDLLCLEVWQPLAKLSYAAYLIHTSVLILNYCQRDRPVDWSTANFSFNCVSFIVVSLLAAFCLWISVEKPLANLQAHLLGDRSREGAQ